MLKTILIIVFTCWNFVAIAQDTTANTYPTKLNKKKLYSAIAFETAFYLSGNAYLQYIWYKDSERVPFHFYNDNAGYLQIDKFGHAFGAYTESYSGYHSLRKAGVSKKKALIYGGSLGLFLQTPIEIFDGIYDGWGFSWGDMLANATGSALVIGNELLFEEQLVKYKFTYSNSEYRAQSNGYLGKTALQGFFYDYNAHTYWLSAPINRVLLKEKIPNWVCLAVGYSANGMFGEFENINYYYGVAIPKTERYRQFLISLDIDWTKIETNSKLVQKLLNTMTFIKLPFPALAIASNGNVKGYWMYY